MSANTQSVLVVEDEASIASFVSLYLKNAGYEVRTASNGTDALASAQSEQPSLIVLDLMLPDIDGIEICRRLRQKSDVPITMLTARDEDVDKIIGLEVGADDYLTKPFNPRELVARVKSILRRASPERRQVESKQLRHGRRPGTRGGVGFAPRQDIGPGIRQPHDASAHGKPIEDELEQLRHQPIFFRLLAKRRAFST